MKANFKSIASLFLALVIMISVFAPTTVSAASIDDNSVENVVVEAKSNVIETKVTVDKMSKSVVKEKEEEIKFTIDSIPLMNQKEKGDGETTPYNEIPYGRHGTIASHGCGLVSIMMIASYLTDTPHDPAEYAPYDKFGHYNTDAGSKWIIFRETAEELGLPFEDSGTANGEWYDWDKVVEALENKQPVVCLQGSGYFTSGGHFIVLTGITEDGKIMVNDPNGSNWDKNSMMVDGFANGFTPSQIRRSACAYWIYGAKEVEEATVEVETEPTKAVETPVTNNKTKPTNPAIG